MNVWVVYFVESKDEIIDEDFILGVYSNAALAAQAAIKHICTTYNNDYNYITKIMLDGINYGVAYISVKGIDYSYDLLFERCPLNKFN